MRKIIPAVAAVLLVAATACEENVGPPPPPPPQLFGSPADVLITVEYSFNQRDVDLLKRALSPNFVYYTRPGEIGRPRPEGTPSRPPPIYNFTEFWNIAHNMFNTAYLINLSIPTGGIGEPAPEENTFRAVDVRVSLIVMVDENRGYLVDKGYCHFEFEKYMDEQGRDRWRLTKWWDDTEGGAEEPPGIEHVPLWFILSLFE